VHERRGERVESGGGWAAARGNAEESAATGEGWRESLFAAWRAPANPIHSAGANARVSPHRPLVARVGKVYAAVSVWRRAELPAVGQAARIGVSSAVLDVGGKVEFEGLRVE
jgi:hypothetical protein